MSELRLQLDVTPPHRIRYYEEAGVVRRAFWLAGRAVVFQLTQQDDDGPVTVHAYSDRPLDDVSDRVRDAARHMLAVDDDLAGFHAVVANDPPMAELAARLPGFKPLRVPDPWTSLVWALIDQRLSNEAGRFIRGHIADRFGPKIEVDGEQVAVLPDPQTVLDTPHRELCETGLSERKAEYMKEIARAALDGKIELETVAGMEPGAALQYLIDLRGIGQWTGEVAAIFGLGLRDVLPAGDPRIRRALGRLYGLPQTPDSGEILRIAKRWTGWRSYAAVYLWRAGMPVAAGS